MINDNRTYYRALDGFRAIAVMFILFMHSGFSCFSTLWTGVPMFFVLSGFLITGILLQNVKSERYFRAFYYKRTLRIFPIYYLLYVFCLLWAKLVNANLTQWPVYLLYLQSFTISLNLKPFFCNGLLDHTWSLSVEELFYLLWPMIVLLFKSRLKHICLLTGLFCIVAKLTVALFFYSERSQALVLLTLPGNLDSLMAGALLAVIQFEKKQDLVPGVKQGTLLPLFALLFAAVIGLSYYPFTPGYAAFIKVVLSIATVFFSYYLIELIVHKGDRTLTGKVLGNGMLVFIGKISYGIYLYHYVVFSFTDSFLFHYKLHAGPALIFTIKAALTFGCAIVSWNIIERPLLKLKDKISYQAV